jgi:hypothetical protein
MRKLPGLLLLVVISSSLTGIKQANADEFANPILHTVRIDDDMIEATLTWSTSSTTDEDDIDDYAYTLDGLNYIALFGSYNSNYVSESQTTTIRLPNRANSKTQVFAIGKIRDNRITSSSNFIRARISEQPVPTVVDFQKVSSGTLVYQIKTYNSRAVDYGAIKYKVSQIKASRASKVRVEIQGDLILVSGYAPGEKVAFRAIKYVSLCDGFSPYLSCPYNSKADVKVDWSRISLTPQSK